MTIQQPNDGLQGLMPVEPQPAFGKMPNAQHQTFHGFMTADRYKLAIIEFDDQGRCYDRGQMDGVAQEIDRLRAMEQDVILLVFVHGWKHNARSDDENLSEFRVLLGQTAEHERETTPQGQASRPVLGIFVGWRGLSEFGLGDAVADVTFWTRQAAGHRVATGSVRELFGRLRHYRNHRLNRDDAAPLLVIAGHSFGGMIVYSALSQSLIEAASAPAGELVSGFADLVLLVNPAIEGAGYIPIQDLVCSAAFKARTTTQLPVFICAQAENDQPVGTFFPASASTREISQATIGELEEECLTHAIGFVQSFRTHELHGPAGADPFVLDPPGSVQVNPYWIIGADKAVIDGHGGIWQTPFQVFLASIVFKRVRASKEPVGTAATKGEGSTDDLATFARTIRPR